MPTNQPLSRWATASVAAWLVTLALLTGCASPQYQAPDPEPALTAIEVEQQQSQALAHQHRQQQRLARVGWPLLRENAELCNKTQPVLGISYANSHSFSEQARDTALRDLQLGNSLQLLYVVPGSPADQAGLNSGDRLVSINDQSFPTGKAALTQAPKLIDQQLADAAPIRLKLERTGQLLALELTPVRVCDYPIRLLYSDQVNAFADHRKISITEGMLDFTRTDRDLALVIAHELAHNLLDHVPGTLRNGLIGSGIDLLLLSQGIPSPGAFTVGGLRSYAQAFETEADYLALYLLARAGYPLEGSADFWRRMSHSRPDHISNDSDASHPGSARRYRVMKATQAEIEAKRANHQPLMPTPVSR